MEQKWKVYQHHRHSVTPRRQHGQRPGGHRAGVQEIDRQDPFGYQFADDEFAKKFRDGSRSAGLLSREFVGMVSLSLLIGGPVAWWFMHSWLNNYQYRADLSWWIFAAAAIGAIGITLLTVSYQAIKAALANPVKSLRSE